MKLSELLQDVRVLESTVDFDTEITGVSYDSRKVQPGHVFVAVTGYALDGHRFIPDAVDSGAVCVVCEQKPQVEIPYVLVTDSRPALAVMGTRRRRCRFSASPAPTGRPP